MLLSFILYREQGQLIVSSSQPRCCCSTTWLKTLCSSCRAIPPFFVASFSIKPRIVALLSSFITVDKKKKKYTDFQNTRDFSQHSFITIFFFLLFFFFFFPLRITHSNRGTVTVCSTFIYLSQNIGSHYGFHFSFRPVKFCHSRVFRSSPIFFFFSFLFFVRFFFFFFLDLVISYRINIRRNAAKGYF